jgi:hypothetical protein
VRVRGAIWTLIVLTAGVCATSAQAATTIGNNLSTTPAAALSRATVVSNTTLPLASTSPGGLYAPAAGVITSWAVRTSGPSPVGNTVRLRVLAGNLFVATGLTRPAPDTAGVTVFPDRIPISAGQRIGLEVGTTGPTVSVPVAVSTGGASFDYWYPPFPDGESHTPDGTLGTYQAVFQATIEADADADGFGDETQDGCLGEPGPRGGCPNPPPPPTAPETEITSGPANKITKPKATFVFSSPSAGATFECALDKAGFGDCSSPKKLKKLANGKHVFRVRAISADA